MNIHDKLKLLSKLDVGKTLSSSSLEILDHNAWSTTFWRKYAGESRSDTLNAISKIFKEALVEFSDREKTILEQLELKEEINRAIEGVRNLKVTYKADANVILQVEGIISEVNLAVTDQVEQWLSNLKADRVKHESWELQIEEVKEDTEVEGEFINAVKTVELPIESIQMIDMMAKTNLEALRSNSTEESPNSFRSSFRKESEDKSDSDQVDEVSNESSSEDEDGGSSDDDDQKSHSSSSTHSSNLKNNGLNIYGTSPAQRRVFINQHFANFSDLKRISSLPNMTDNSLEIVKMYGPKEPKTLKNIKLHKVILHDAL